MTTEADPLIRLTTKGRKGKAEMRLSKAAYLMSATWEYGFSATQVEALFAEKYAEAMAAKLESFPVRVGFEEVARVYL